MTNVTLTQLVSAAEQISTPLNGKVITLRLSPVEILESIEGLLDRLNALELRDGACEYLEEKSADHLLTLSGELREASQIIFDVVHNHWMMQAEDSIALASKN